ncbi:bis(5'-nucleosyl)-tetraphosphatase (symmetrical) YqeK [Pseudostreptobacillus hongkongensis]|uniref:bis(5'-nucleosyl)-tetraphosphatase (symmetrical) YqeK n=1 Tax=Pseudostreptobacillus hongkongensis TaxID=1162717 RepID=UPI0028D2E571|nr:bis(5'-nucleosyl)-tetraphosphatase (symmetrical) YqeK [Pseudostreptobacillus hongkongensis]
MENFEFYEKTQKALIPEKRYNHVLRVRDKAIELAKIYNAPIESVEIASYFHDLAKNFKDEDALNIIDDKYKYIFENGFNINQILHGFAAADYIKKNFNITDEAILDAIRYHTIGRSNMTLIDKIVYLADAIEDGRDYPGVDEIRNLAKTNLEKAILLELDIKIKHLIDKESLIHPNTIELRNSLIKEVK